LGLISLLEIFDLILKGKFYPVIWKKFTVILLQKPSKVDYRPISLASCILKLLEKLVKRRLERYMEMDCLIPEPQYGFGKGKSCFDECLAILNLEIYNSFIKSEYVGAIFLDIKSAYNVYPPILFNIINDLKISLDSKFSLKKLLDFRIIDIYESSSYQGTRSLFKDLPQGSVLSPFIVYLYVRDILQNIPCNCKVIQFTDDIGCFPFRQHSRHF